MGSFDGTIICELVGLYILHISGEKYGKEIIGLYRDDGNIIGPKTHRITKNFINIFKNNFHLNIVCNTNLKIANFLNVTLNLSRGKYQPYNKPGDTPLYINISSRHLSSIIKNLPESFFCCIS